jgi:phage terminase large subunit-like protein
MPSEVSDLLRFNFCVWTQAQSRAIDLGRWAICGQLADVSDTDLADATCYGGLDLGLNDDLSAFAKVWELEDGRVVMRVRFWTPEAALIRFPNRPYEQWKAAGILEVTEGDATDYARVQEAIEKDCNDFAVRSVSYDPRFASQMAQYLMGQGIDVVKKPQGFPLSEATHRFLALIADGELVHGNNPILNVQAGNFVVRHGKPGEIRPDKESSPEKIDGLVAAIMAIDEGLVRNQTSGKSVYDDDDAEIFTV